MGGSGGGSWTRGRTVACWMSCSILMTAGGSRTTSGCWGLAAGGSCGVTCMPGGGGGSLSGGSVALGSSVAGCSRALRAFCSHRCHCEGWQQSGGFFIRIVIPCPQALRKRLVSNPGQASSQGPPPPVPLPASGPSKAPEKNTANLMTEQPSP